MHRARLLLAVAGLLLAGVGACSSEDGRALPPPDPSTTTTTSTTTPGDAIGSPSTVEGVQEVFSIFSTAFSEGTAIPERHTCEGDDVSPPLDWVGIPAAAELAIVVRDRDAGGFVHWVLTGIDPTVHGIGEDGIPETAVEATNGFGTIGWRGSCPPEGSGLHTYVFALHAVAAPLGLESGAPAEEAAAAVEAASIGQATLTGTAVG